MRQVENPENNARLTILSFLLYFLVFFFSFAYFFPPTNPLELNVSTPEIDFSTTPVSASLTQEKAKTIIEDKEAIIEERNKTIAFLESKLLQEKLQRDSLQESLSGSPPTPLPHLDSPSEDPSVAHEHFLYEPINYEQTLLDLGIIDALNVVLISGVFRDLTSRLKLVFFETRNNVRAKFKNESVNLFAPHSLPKAELFSVIVHEMGHYVDLMYLDDEWLGDKSVDFYQYSWESSKVLKKGQKSSNFVSGYAMTNKYEDFAESYTYFVLHNDEFLKKAQNNRTLLRKYDFFVKNVFRKGEFQNTSFTNEPNVSNYYWDITKIDIKIEKFLEYLEKGL